MPADQPLEIAIVGAGRTGTALATHWAQAGHRIVAVAGREATRERAKRWLPQAKFLPAPAAAHAAGVVVIGVPDDLIAPVCDGLAQRDSFAERARVMHLSGAIGLDALEPARERGAIVMSLHPLMTFPDVDSAVRRIADCPMAVTAREEEAAWFGERLARDAGARPFRLDDGAKGVYHAAAVFASNYLVTVAAEAASLFANAGVKQPVETFMPLARASLENVGSLGPAAALTGPAVRGDADTVELNLEAISRVAPAGVAAYVELAELAVELGLRSGRLDAEGAGSVREVLAKWRS
jgi:predicted short-subunit dehydrogenase-like oxidoreductase (DUF2520 family)